MKETYCRLKYRVVHRCDITAGVRLERAMFAPLCIQQGYVYTTSTSAANILNEVHPVVLLWIIRVCMSRQTYSGRCEYGVIQCVQQFCVLCSAVRCVAKRGAPAWVNCMHATSALLGLMFKLAPQRIIRL